MKPPLLLFSIVFITWLIVGAPAGFSDFQIILQLRRGCKYLGFNIFSRKGRIFFKGNLHNFLKYVFSRRGSKYYLRRSKILSRGCKYCKQSGGSVLSHTFSSTSVPLVVFNLEVLQKIIFLGGDRLQLSKRFNKERKSFFPVVPVKQLF